MKLVAGFNYFTNFSVKSDANQVTVFNFTKFSVKIDENEVTGFNLTKFYVKLNAIARKQF